ncbi:MAG TPA: PilN domain-containing protein [Polyangiaceae bacterium]|nr:PilN domain-containing protein [Polyangiaceae bacterium]
MIRINLLPQKKRRIDAGSGGELWILAALGVVVLEIIALFFFNGYKEGQLADELAENSKIQTKIQVSKNAVANQAEVKAELDRLRAREDAIAKLQSARTGPTAILLEISRLLTPGRGPSVDPEKLAQVRRENPLAVYNPAWDPRRLWITEFVEESRLLRIKGVARDGGDVSELARRMILSDYFDDVRLLPARRTNDRDTSLEVVEFALEAKVNY